MSTRYRRNPSVLWRRTSAALVVLAPGTGDVITLEGTGVALWEALEAESNIEELTDRLVARFGAERSGVARDIEPTLQRLVGAHVLLA